MQNEKKLRLVIDTNLWISFLISKRLKRLDTIILGQRFQLLFSEESLAEIFRVVMRPKFQRYFSDHDVQELKEHLYSNVQIVNVKSVVELCRDPKDNFLLALAKDGNADYLITGDDDLLTLKNFGKTKIVKITEFEQSV